MKNLLNKYTNIFLIILIAIIVVSTIIAIGLGPVSIPFSDVWNIVFLKVTGYDISNYQANLVNIVWELRVPRVLLGLVVGAGLSLSGVGMQAFTKNPLADPYILGISAGASSGAVIAVLTNLLDIFGVFSIPVGAFLGALSTLFIVYIFSNNRNGIMPIKLILTGIAVSAAFNALTNYLIFNAPNENGIRNATFWMMGGLGGTKWVFLIAPAIILIISFIIMMILSNSLNAMLLGETTALTLGINVKTTRNIIVIITALLTGSVVAVSGCIGFVGLVIPHISRTLIGSDHKKVIPLSCLMGALFILWCDVLSRVIAGNTEIPIGIITAFIGAPFFIWLVRKSNYSFGD